MVDLAKVRGWLIELGHMRVYHQVTFTTVLGRDAGPSAIGLTVLWLDLNMDERRELFKALLSEYEEEWIEAALNLETVGDLIRWAEEVRNVG